MTKFSINNYEKGYFKAPNFIFDPSLPLKPNSRLIWCYLCRRADKKGLSYPSLERISKDIGIKSDNTVRNALRELDKLGIIKIISPQRKGGSNHYILTQPILDTVFNNNNQSDAVDDKTYPSNIKDEYSNNEHTYSKNEQVDTQILSTKEYSVKENTIKEKIDKISEEDLTKKVKKHMESLTIDERRLFDSIVLSRVEFSCPKPKLNSPEMNRLRYEYLIEIEDE